jgi:hypothetical protein
VTCRRPTPHELDILLRLNETEPWETRRVAELVWRSALGPIRSALARLDLLELEKCGWVKAVNLGDCTPGKRRWAWTRTKAGTAEVKRKK